MWLVIMRMVQKSWLCTDEVSKTQLRSAELANGRLAMMAIIGMFFQACASVQAMQDKVQHVQYEGRSNFEEQL